MSRPIVTDINKLLEFFEIRPDLPDPKENKGAYYQEMKVRTGGFRQFIAEFSAEATTVSRVYKRETIMFGDKRLWFWVEDKKQ